MRLLVFALSVAVGVAGVGTLNWWIDPFADRYDGDVLRTALEHEPCFISHVVVGERTWPQFKLDLARRRDARTVVVGTSRVWKLAARPGETGFVNLSLPSLGVEGLESLFRRLADQHRGPLTVYLGVESFWFSRVPGRAFFDDTIADDFRYLLSSETLRSTLDVLRRAPGALDDPWSLRRWQLGQTPRGCLLDRGDSVLGGAANVWATDGTWHWQWELAGGRVPPGQSYVATHRPNFIGTDLDAAKLRMLERALAFARAHGWRVRGFAPPYTHDSLRTLQSDPATAGLLSRFRARMPGVFARYGYSLVDVSDVAAVPCDEDQFTWYDGAHIDDACSARLRRKLEGGGSAR